MHKEQITDKEAICLLITFIMGSTLIVGVGGSAKNDAWIAAIMGIIAALPFVFMYSRILSLFPGRDIFDILNISTGKVIGKTIALLYIWYAFHLGALVMRNFGEFVNTVTLPETPMLVPMFYLALVCIIAVRSGVEVMARISAFVLPVLLFIIVIVQLLAIPEFHLNYLKPVLGNGIAPVLKGGFSAFSFPFAETVLFTGIFFALKNKRSPYKVYFSGLLLAGAIITAIAIRNIGVLGTLSESLYFPSHVAVSRIIVGDFLQRIEVSVAIIFAFGAFIKISVCLLVACIGMGKLFNLKDYRSVVIQTGLLMVYFAYILYDNIMLMQYWAFKVYPYYAFPFQVILPVLIWIAVEIRARRI